MIPSLEFLQAFFSSLLLPSGPNQGRSIWRQYRSTCEVPSGWSAVQKERLGGGEGEGESMPWALPPPPPPPLPPLLVTSSSPFLVSPFSSLSAAFPLVSSSSRRREATSARRRAISSAGGRREGDILFFFGVKSRAKEKKLARCILSPSSSFLQTKNHHRITKKKNETHGIYTTPKCEKEKKSR